MADKIEIEEYDPNKDYGAELKESLLDDIKKVEAAGSVEDLKPIIIELLLMQMVST